MKIILTVVIGVLSLCPVARSQTSAPDADRFHQLGSVDAFIAKSLDRTGGGCAVLLIQGDRVVYRKAFGTFTPEKVVPIASASKWLSAAVIMILVDEGKISLDDTASKFLPEFTGKKGQITIRQMFSHTHGFAIPDEPHLHLDITKTEAISRIAATPLACDPGTALLYSGAGMEMAARICEVVSGKTWKELFREKLGEPLRMPHTHYEAFGPTENPQVAGGAASCIDDYGHFLRMLLGGGVFEGRRVLSAASVETMLRNQTGELPIRKSACAQLVDFDAGFAAARYGIGCWLERIDSQGRAHEASSIGALGCFPFIDRDRGIGGVYLPCRKVWKRNSRGQPYNDVTAVFLELRPIIRAAFDGRKTTAAESGDPPAPKKERLGPGEHSLTLQVGDLERRYLLHVPPGYDGKKPVPVVIMFHGGGGTGQSAMRETGWAQKADTEGFLAVFPNATPPDPTKPIRFGTNGQIWNDGSGRFHAGQKNIPDVAFINAMIDDLIARFNVDRRRIYATGFSNGASMTFRVGVELSARIAAIAPFAGALWIKQPKLDRPVSLYYITGDADPLNPFEGGTPKFATGAASRDMASQPKPPAREHVATWARLLGCQADPRSAPASPGVTTLIYSGGRDDSEVRFTIIKDHGHVWPGGKNQLPESWVGKASDKFNATDAIWEFFQNHQLK